MTACDRVRQNSSPRLMERRDSDPTVMLGLVVVTLITVLAVATIIVILAVT